MTLSDGAKTNPIGWVGGDGQGVSRSLREQRCFFTHRVGERNGAIVGEELGVLPA